VAVGGHDLGLGRAQRDQDLTVLVHHRLHRLLVDERAPQL